MFAQHKKFLLVIVLTVLIAAGALAFVVGRTHGRPSDTGFGAPLPSSNSPVQERDLRIQRKHRNLSLHPEAFNMGRRLGKRFSPSKRERSILVGTLTIGSNQRNVQTTRLQTDDGEQVEITIAGTPGTLSWDTAQGTKTSAGRATGSDRELAERLVLDSPDQFVMAQLRGASYSMVARNARPTEADDNYAGPLWNIVRVGEPKGNEEKRPQSEWRLYYINTRTGLIDRIVSELRGERIEAEILVWTVVGGENVPAQITWKSNGQRIMRYELTNFSRGQQ